MADEADDGTEPERDGSEGAGAGADGADEQREPGRPTDDDGADGPDGAPDADRGSDARAGDEESAEDAAGDAPSPAAGASEREDWSDVDLDETDFASEYVGNDRPDDPDESAAADGTAADGGEGTQEDDARPDGDAEPGSAPGPDGTGTAGTPDVAAGADQAGETGAAGQEEAVDPETGVPEPDDSNFGEGSRHGPAEHERPDNMAEATPVERKTGPAADEEMPLADHVEEMVARLFVVVAVAGVVSVALFPFGEEVIELLWYQVLPGGDIARPRLYHPLALVITQLKVASLGGLIVALPVFVYQTYAFMRPGLYPHERRYYLAAVPTSLVLAFVGVTFAYFVVLPAIFTYFLYYTDAVATIAFALSDTFNLILLLMGYLAIVFQIPLFIMLAIMMGLTTRRWMENRRLYFWAAFLGISFIFNPDPTGMAPFIVTATMITLFEGTLALLRWTGR